MSREVNESVITGTQKASVTKDLTGNELLAEILDQLKLVNIYLSSMSGLEVTLDDIDTE